MKLVAPVKTTGSFWEPAMPKHKVVRSFNNHRQRFSDFRFDSRVECYRLGFCQSTLGATTNRRSCGRRRARYPRSMCSGRNSITVSIPNIKHTAVHCACRCRLCWCGLWPAS